METKTKTGRATPVWLVFLSFLFCLCAAHAAPQRDAGGILATTSDASSGSADHRPDDKASRNPTSTLSLTFGAPVGAELPEVDSNGPTAIDAQGNLWFIQTVGGTMRSTPWRIFKGTTMDNLVHQYDYVPDQHWTRAHGDETWWAEGLWIDPTNGNWQVVMHTEYNYNQYSKQPGTGYSMDRMGAVSLATSTDQGRSWIYRGEIIGSDHSDDPKVWAGKNFWDGGQGDPSLFVDADYFYVYYNSRWTSRDDVNVCFSGVRVARCAIADKMAPGTWKKWYQEKWDSPGANGHDSDVFNQNYSDTATVFWSNARKQFVAITLSNLKYIRATGGWEYDGYLSTCTDLSLQNWTKSIRVCEKARKGYYTWVMDPTTWSRYVMETETFRWYGGENKAPGIVVTLTKAPSNVVTQLPLYPPESVDDYNLGWDRAHFSSASDAGYAPPPQYAGSLKATRDGISIGSATTMLTPSATAYLAWRYTNGIAWTESHAPSLESLRTHQTGATFTVNFPEVRADIEITQLKRNLWRLSGRLKHTGTKPIELARFHYLDGEINTSFGHLEIPGGDRFPRLVKAGDSLPAPGPTTEKMWADWNVKLTQLTDPIHNATDWSIGRDTGVFATAWDQPGWTVGFTGPGTAFGEIGFHTKPGPPRFFVGVLLDNILLEPGETRRLENALLYCGDWQEGMKEWALECAREFKVPAPKPPLVGYCSWYQRGHAVQVKDLMRAADEMKDYPTPPGGKTVQVDDGWQIKPGNWFPNEKFAADWKSLPDRIRQAGCLPGMYLVPTAMHESNPLVKKHPEWLQRMPNGEFAVHFANWGGKTYFLEMDHPEVKEFMRTLFKRARDEGWGYIKIDFTYGFSTARAAYDRKKTSFESQRDLYALFREAAGPKMLLNACVGEPARYALGLTEVTRVGGDTGSDWAAVRDNLKRMLVLTATSGTWWQSDPDVFYMRSENTSLNPEESYLLTGTIGMFGGVFLTSDFPSQWSSAAQNAVREFWTAAGPIPPADHRVIWTADGVPRAYRVSHKSGQTQQHRIGIYNWGDKPEDNGIRLEDAGVDSNQPWQLSASAWNKGIRLENGRLLFKQQPPHSLRMADLSLSQ